MRYSNWFTKLPPAPGKEGKKTLAGIDINHNGIRDDVERFVVMEYWGQIKLMETVLDLMRLEQQRIVNYHDRNAIFTGDKEYTSS